MTLPRPPACWPFVVTRVLHRAGWYPGRDVAPQVEAWRRLLTVEGGFAWFPAAEVALREFGGLKLRQLAEAGNVIFRAVDLDPAVHVLEENWFGECEAEVGERLFPLGTLDQSEMYLAVGESGAVYALTSGIYLCIGDSMAWALRYLVLGRKPTP